MARQAAPGQTSDPRNNTHAETTISLLHQLQSSLRVFRHAASHTNRRFQRNQESSHAGNDRESQNADLSAWHRQTSEIRANFGPTHWKGLSFPFRAGTTIRSCLTSASRLFQLFRQLCHTSAELCRRCRQLQRLATVHRPQHRLRLIR